MKPRQSIKFHNLLFSPALCRLNQVDKFGVFVRAHDIDMVHSE